MKKDLTSQQILKRLFTLNQIDLNEYITIIDGQNSDQLIKKVQKMQKSIIKDMYKKSGKKYL